MNTDQLIQEAEVIEQAVPEQLKNSISNLEEELQDKTFRNAGSLSLELSWFTKVVNTRLDKYFKQESKPVNNSDENNWFENLLGRKEERENGAGRNEGQEKRPMGQLSPPAPENDSSVYAEFIRHYQLNSDERLLLILAIIPHIQPHLLDVFLIQNSSLARPYSEFGGIKGNHHNGFLPTLETALFILAGQDLNARFDTYYLFETDHFFTSHNIIHFERKHGDEPFFTSSLRLSDEYVDFFTKGVLRKPQFSMDFPAKQLTTQMDWEDLVVDEFTAQQLDEIRIWLTHHNTLYGEWGMSKKLKPGYKALFYGPPGTGKTLTASLLGKVFNLEVYKVDLSMVISKYIGETEKNLEKVFKKAENKNWILFFDEADSLFGKRTSISDSHDKYANQEIAYLLQRLEDFQGLVILASNMRNNVDEAFTRRLQSIIHFTKPQARERIRLWNNAFSPACQTPPTEELTRIANQYELSGGSIMNVVQYTSLKALNRGDNVILKEDILEGIQKEFKKEGKTM